MAFLNTSNAHKSGLAFNEADLTKTEFKKIQAIVLEVLEKYNPQRPIVDIWDPFLEAEKFYHANNVLTEYISFNGEPPKLITFNYSGYATDRIDWLVQHVLDYPEIIILMEEDGERFSDTLMVAIGRMSPDWNVVTLPDGRTFREKPGYFYEFTYSEMEQEFPPIGTIHTRRTGHSGTDATLIQINLNETSDEELKALNGWDYHINPYTQEVYQK